MKYSRELINQIRNQKHGWKPAEIDSWINKKLAEVKETNPDLWQYLKETHQELHQYVCRELTKEASGKTCPAEKVSRLFLLKVLELIEMFQADAEIKNLEQLWKD